MDEGRDVEVSASANFRPFPPSRLRSQPPKLQRLSNGGRRGGGEKTNRVIKPLYTSRARSVLAAAGPPPSAHRSRTSGVRIRLQLYPGPAGRCPRFIIGDAWSGLVYLWMKKTVHASFRSAAHESCAGPGKRPAKNRWFLFAIQAMHRLATGGGRARPTLGCAASRIFFGIDDLLWTAKLVRGRCCSCAP